MLLILNVVYVLVAIAMIALILMQRGAGAQAGSGFGGGASATVFGSRGASNFLSKSTKWLAIVFFAVALFMAWYATHSAKPQAASEQDLGVMSQTAVPAADSKTPSIPVQALPQAAPMPDSANKPPVPAVETAPATAAPAQSDPGTAATEKEG